MAAEQDDKTEDATEHRQNEARMQGQVAKSTDLTAASLMLAAACSLLVLLPELSQSLAEFTRHSLSHVTLRIDPGWALERLQSLLQFIAVTVAPSLLLTAAVLIGVNLAQVGFLIAPAALQPKFSRLNPLGGVQRILSVQSVMKLFVSLGKLALLATVTVFMLHWALPEILALTSASVGALASSMHTHMTRLAFVLAAVLLCLALCDYMFQLWKHQQDLRMSKQELRDEMKNMDGDPHIRQRRREVHRKLATAREMKSVKTADVIVTNPTHYAVAIKYDPSKMAAPIVVAKGVDEAALQIRRIAGENAVPILERPALARQLHKDVRVGWPIPAELYATFAEILHYVYRITGRNPSQLLEPSRRANRQANQWSTSADEQGPATREPR